MTFGCTPLRVTLKSLIDTRVEAFDGLLYGSSTELHANPDTVETQRWLGCERRVGHEANFSIERKLRSDVTHHRRSTGD